MRLHLLRRHQQAQAETTTATDCLDPREVSLQQPPHHLTARAGQDLQQGQLHGKPTSCKAELCSLGQNDVPQAGITAQA